MTTQVTITSPQGRSMTLLPRGNWQHALAYGGLTGLVGTADTSAVTSVGVPGQTPTAQQVKEMKGELKILLDSSVPGVVEKLEAQVRGMFSVDFDQPSTVVLTRAGRRLTCHARLDGYIDPPVEVLEDATEAEMMIPLIADKGLWARDAVTAAGVVTVTNHGDVFLHPEILWDTDNATLTLPSQTVVPLPPAGGQMMRMSLDPWTSHEVTRVDDGGVDEALTEITEMLPLGEGVPKRQTRTYRADGGARVQWRIHVLDPWR